MFLFLQIFLHTFGITIFTTNNSSFVLSTIENHMFLESYWEEINHISFKLQLILQYFWAVMLFLHRFWKHMFFPLTLILPCYKLERKCLGKTHFLNISLSKIFHHFWNSWMSDAFQKCLIWSVWNILNCRKKVRNGNYKKWQSFLICSSII